MAIVDEEHKVAHHGMLGSPVIRHLDGKLFIVSIDGRIFDILRFFLIHFGIHLKQIIAVGPYKNRRIAIFHDSHVLRLYFAILLGLCVKRNGSYDIV